MLVWYNLLVTVNSTVKLFQPKRYSALKQSGWRMAGAVWGLLRDDWANTWLYLSVSETSELTFATVVFFLLKPKANHLLLSLRQRWKKCRCLRSGCLSPCQCVIIALRHLSFLQTNLAASRPPTNHKCKKWALLDWPAGCIAVQLVGSYYVLCATLWAFNARNWTVMHIMTGQYQDWEREWMVFQS